MRFCTGEICHSPKELFDLLLSDYQSYMEVELLMIAVAPIVVALTFFVWICLGLVYVSGLVLGLISTITKVCIMTESCHFDDKNSLSGSLCVWRGGSIMATTRIMPLHVGKGRAESRAISDIIDYVANPQKTDNGRLITGFACDSQTADAEFLLAKRQYIAATGRVRGADDVIANHVRQSFRPGEITPEEANRLGVEFARRFTKGNHMMNFNDNVRKDLNYG